MPHRLRRPLGTILFGLSFLANAAGAAAQEKEQEQHWSLCKRGRPAVPQFSASAGPWLRNPIDAFVLARLRKEGLEPAPEADRRTLIRRVYFDLTGLPPTPVQVADFVNDPAPDAYERLVDRLLASPHYGERWGRHWLDIVRFAETEGFEYDRTVPGAWRYRDYVIGSFNQDKPYDRFVLEQLAGDEIAAGNQECQTAAGFYRLGPVRRNAGNPDIAFSKQEVLTEMTDAIGAVFLGLTVGCARCHDHKFDEIQQADYYRLQAFLAAMQEHDVSLADPKVQAEWNMRAATVKEEMKKIRVELASLEGEAKKRMEEKLKEAERKMPPPLPTISSVADLEAQRIPIHVLKRGDPEKKGKQVGPRVLGALIPEGTPELPPALKEPRTVLAKWIGDPDNPLTARVLVNRVWQFHFGRGIVETANDFGVNGARPSHPELLDYLANQLVADGWRVKSLHRLILQSSTYRQASRPSNPLLAKQKDPTNRLLSCFPRRRLEAEAIRDAMLAIAGKLNGKAGGPSVALPVDKDLVQQLYQPSQWVVTADEAEHSRRSIYLLAKRNLRLPFTEVFDQPDAQTSCPCRVSSTHAPQALELLNGKTSNQLAEVFAERLVREAGTEPGRQVELAYLLTTGRAPTSEEKQLAMRFLQTQPLREFALAMFNLNAFLYVN